MKHTGAPLGRRAILRALLTAGVSVPGIGAGAGCAWDNQPPRPAARSTSSTSNTGGPPVPLRTPLPGQHIAQVATLSSSDLDVVHSLGVDPVVAWAADGVGGRPWRQTRRLATPSWDNPGVPDAATLSRWTPDAIMVAGADLSFAQMRSLESMSAVIADPAGRPRWQAHLQLAATALDRDPTGTIASTRHDLESWAEEQREAGIAQIAVVVATGMTADTPVATVNRDQPMAKEIAALKFEVIDSPDPVPLRQLRAPQRRILTIDPRDENMMVAAVQPSVLSLPWLLAELSR